MNSYEKYFSIINELLEVKTDGNKIFKILQKVINFESGYIFFLNPEHIVYSYNPKVKNIEDIKAPYIKEKLKLNNTVFGIIILTGKNFSENECKIFKTFASIISNITKDIEINKIIKMQIQALQENYIEIQNNNQKLIESEKLKTDFISHLSHELRTPLTSILGFSDLLQNEFIGPLNNKQKEYISDIQASGINLLGMINEVLDMAKLEANKSKLNKKTFNIAQAIIETINIIKPLAIKKRQELIYTPTNIEINADYQKIQQILFNLLSNAIKYTQNNGTIKISTIKENDKLNIIVEDNGCGIAPEFKKKIFEKFEQKSTQNEYSTGLGLTITKELIKQHKGRINVESKVGKGSKFKVILPI